MGKHDTSRRTFLKGSLAATAMGATGTGLLLKPGRAMAAAPRDRKFLFFFAGGGWDTSTVYEPKFGDDAGGVDMDMDTFLGQSGELRWTAGDDRPAVSRYFERWGWRSSIVNGIDTHSIGHGAGTRFMLTGSSASSLSDWPTLLASQTEVGFSMPHVVFGGPSFAGTRGSALVRGGGGRVIDLIDGSIAGQADIPTPQLARPADFMVDAYVHGRIDRFALAKQGLGRRRGEELLASLERAMELEGREFEAGLRTQTREVYDQAVRATELMRLGLSRCAMLRIPGGYDTHGNNAPQAPQQDAFYDMLDRLMDHLALTPGHTSSTLLDEVVIVAMSELGRTPRLNGGGGKDHWPFGSMLVAGPGVRGGRTIGKTDPGLVGMKIDHATGLPSESGDLLGCESVGAALLKLGGVDHDAFLQGVQVLDALIA